MTAAASPEAALIESLWWPVLWLLTGVWVVTMAAVALAVRRGTAGGSPPSDLRLAQGIAGGAGVSLVLLLGYLVASLLTDRALAQRAPDEPLQVEVTGRQWWWEVTYADSLPARRLTTANEIHIPVGRPVRLVLRSGDVIHSLWVPALQGKKDLVPAHPTDLWLQADSAGVYEGQCAEFCGHQHAKMRLYVIAEPEARFRAWYDAQLEPALPPADTLSARGLEVFTTGPCVMCHTVRGTVAGGRVAPDLTHLASRTRIASGALPNTRGHLAGWVLDAQSVKPGARMPPVQLSPEQLEALLAYLEGLR